MKTRIYATPAVKGLMLAQRHRRVVFAGHLSCMPRSKVIVAFHLEMSRIISKFMRS